MTEQQKKTVRKETRPEQYLREIRDLQKQNTQILERLWKIEQKEVSRRKWKTGTRIVGALLPYAFSLFVAWTFYAKVQDSFDTMKSFIVELPSMVGLSFTENLPSSSSLNLDSIKDSGNEVWENREGYLKDAKDAINTYILE